MSSDTVEKRPIPKRPKWGWMAWEATVGYIAQQHSPDAALKLEIYPMEHIIGWAAALAWGGNAEHIRDQMTFSDALNGLWNKVEQDYQIFHSLEAAARRPANYDDEFWLDEKTYETFSRLVNVTDTILNGDWQILIAYRPVEIPDKRHQARLIAKGGSLSRAGRGSTLREASRSLYHNAAPIYKMFKDNDQTS